MHNDLGCLPVLEEMICSVPLVNADLMRDHLVRVDLALTHELQRRLPVVRILTAASDNGQFLLDDLGEIDRHFVQSKQTTQERRVGKESLETCRNRWSP